MGFPLVPVMAAGGFYKMPILGDCQLVVPTEFSKDRIELIDQLEDFALAQFAHDKVIRAKLQTRYDISNIVYQWIDDNNPEKQK